MDKKQEICLAYAENHKILRKASKYNDLLSLKINSIFANGGWGNMSYDISVSCKLPEQPRKEFEKVYWNWK